MAAVVLGPKTEVDAVCSAVEPGMSVADVRAVADPYDGIDLMATNGGTTLQISKVSNDWICFCSPEIEGGVLTAVDNVYCSD